MGLLVGNYVKFHRVPTVTPGARPLSPVHEDRFHLLAFAPCPGFLYDHRAQ
jgi:hypothetical protein